MTLSLVRASPPPATLAKARSDRLADPEVPDRARGQAQWADALMCLQLMPWAAAWGGVWLRAPHGPVRQTWLQGLERLGLTLWRAPLSSDRERWVGGWDLATSLRQGRLHHQAGLLAQAQGGVLCVPLAERLPADVVGLLSQAMDRGGVDGPQGFQPSRWTLVALDESISDDAPLAAPLQERLGLWIDLEGVWPTDAKLEPLQTPVPSAPEVVAGEAALRALCATAWSLGIDSLRVPQLALAVACAHARQHGRDHVAEEDLQFVCRTVLAPRARQWPAPAEPAEDPPAEAATEPSSAKAPEEATPPADAATTSPPPSQPPTEAEPPASSDATRLEDMMVATAAAHLPADLLQRLHLAMTAGHARTNPAARGRSGAAQQGGLRGRPLAPRQGSPGGGRRLHLLATLRACAPHQRSRGRLASTQALRFRAADLHVHRFEEAQPSCLILALDASGSTALQRLAEARGAVQLLLEQSYARRDSVCVIGFRGAGAQLLLPPTRSLVRARRALSGLPGGGGTPLASALQLAHQQALQLQGQGVSPALVVLSDGRANVTLEGLGGRMQAWAEALKCAQVWGASGWPSLWIDTSVQADVQAQQLAQRMTARYLPMPQVQSQRLAQALTAARAMR